MPGIAARQCETYSRLASEFSGNVASMLSDAGSGPAALKDLTVDADGAAGRAELRATGAADLLDHIQRLESFGRHQGGPGENVGAPVASGFKYGEPVRGGLANQVAGKDPLDFIARGEP